MKRLTAFIGTFILSYLFWILFLMQDFNILKLGFRELIVGAVVAIIVALISSKFFASSSLRLLQYAEKVVPKVLLNVWLT